MKRGKILLEGSNARRFESGLYSLMRRSGVVNRRKAVNGREVMNELLQVAFGREIWKEVRLEDEKNALEKKI